MAEKLNTGSKANFNNKTPEWGSTPPPPPVDDLENGPLPLSINTLPLSDRDELEMPYSLDIPQFNTVDTPEETIADRPDAETLYTDAELLGNNYPVRRMIGEIGTQKVHAVEMIAARLRNISDTPRKLRLQFSQALAERRFNRHKRRVEEVDHLDDSSKLKQRRMAKLAKVEAQFHRKTDNYDDHATMMQGRIDTVHHNTAERRNEKISELKSRRDRALGRKTLRAELRAQGASHLEAAAVLRQTSVEHINRIGNLAATVSLSNRRRDTLNGLGNSQQDLAKSARDIAIEHTAARNKAINEALHTPENS